jgi:hypothetical protein
LLLSWEGSAAHFFEDGAGGGGGIGGLGDGATDDEEAGSCGERGGGSGDALLVGGVGAGRTDAGDDEGCCGVALAEGGDFFRAGDEAIDPRSGGGFSEAQDLVFRGVADADSGELKLIHAGEDSDGEELGRVRNRGGGFRSGFEHGRAAGGVDGEEFGAGGSDGAHGAGDSVGNVVELEVEEDGVAAMAELMDDGGAFGDEELEADLEPLAEALEAAGESESGRSTGVIEGDDEAGVHLLQGTGWRVQGTGHRAQKRRSAYSDRRSGKQSAGRRDSGVVRKGERGVLRFRKGNRGTGD